MRVVLIEGGGHRAGRITRALLEGIPKTGDEIQHIHSENYNGVIDGMDGAIHYGLRGKTFDAFRAYRYHKFSVYIDMGYWGRREGGTYDGFHKVSISDRHPTAYFQRIQHPPDRFNHFNIEIEPWKKDGKHILLAGMGSKAAYVEGFAPSEWERAAIAELRRVTDRPIIYRPKPSWGSPQHLDGSKMIVADEQKLDEALKDCWAVVTHHSNLAVDALVRGIPVFCFHGVAKPMGLTNLRQIEEPIYPENREQWCWDVAYTQWQPAEMARGDMWRHLRREGFLEPGVLPR